MANVDSDLHTAGDPLDRVTETPKRGLRGAAGGIYIGPVVAESAGSGPSDATHATGAEAGGVEDSTGYRESDTYFADGTEGYGVAPTAIRRRTGRDTFTGAAAGGIQGGSVPGYPAQRSGQRASALGGGNFIDKRSTIAGEGGRALGSQGRGTQVLVEVVDEDPDRSGTQGIPRPLTQGTADPAAGTVSVIAGTAEFQADLNATDVTDYAGVEFLVFDRGTDTDEDSGAARKSDLFDSATQGDVLFGGVSTLAAGTYAVYARFVEADGNVGPLSARTTVVVS